VAGRYLGRYASRAVPVALSLAPKAAARVQHTAAKVWQSALRRVVRDSSVHRYSRAVYQKRIELRHQHASPTSFK